MMQSSIENDSELANLIQFLNSVFKITSQKVSPFFTSLYGTHEVSKLKSLIKLCSFVLSSHKSALNFIKELKISQLIYPDSITQIIQSDLSNHIALVIIPFATSLDRILKSKILLTIDHIKFFTFSILIELKKFHARGIIHRNISPSNILINQNEDFKLINYEYSIAHDAQTGPDIFSEYFRLSPEELNKEIVSFSADIWSVGCVFLEMFIKRPVFLGITKKEVLNSIGAEPETQITAAFEETKIEMLDIQHAMALDLAKGMLKLNPIERMNCLQCAQHEFFKDYFEVSFFEEEKTEFIDLNCCNGLSNLHLEIQSEISKFNKVK